MTEQAQSPRARLLEILRVFAKIGAMSYGGAAIMGIMQVEIQQRRGWMSKDRYLEGLALVNMLPGAPATQLAIFIGHDRAGWRGGVLAGIGFVHPGIFRDAGPYAALLERTAPCPSCATRSTGSGRWCWAYSW